jgi:hypothetical protein
MSVNSRGHEIYAPMGTDQLELQELDVQWLSIGRLDDLGSRGILLRSLLDNP